MVARFKTGLLEDTQIAGQFSQDVNTTTGLTFGMRAGFFTLNNRLDEISASTVTLTDDDINFVYIDWSVTPAVMRVAITEWPSVEYTPCYKVTTVSGAITNIESWRVRSTSVNEIVV